MKTKGLRWWVVGLVALAAVINYIDRQAFGALWPDIANDLFPEMDKDGHKAIYGTISKFSYSLMLEDKRFLVKFSIG